MSKQDTDRNKAALTVATECSLNPLFQGSYKWGDRRNTTVELRLDGAAVITQGGQTIVIESLGFFRDVTQVTDAAIDAMPDSKIKDMFVYSSLGSSRTLPTCTLD